MRRIAAVVFLLLAFVRPPYSAAQESRPSLDSTSPRMVEALGLALPLRCSADNEFIGRVNDARATPQLPCRNVNYLQKGIYA